MLPYLLACYDRQRHVLRKSSGTQSDFRVTIITFAFVAYTEHDFPLVLQRVASELVEQDAIFESRRACAHCGRNLGTGARFLAGRGYLRR